MIENARQGVEFPGVRAVIDENDNQPAAGPGAAPEVGLRQADGEEEEPAGKVLSAEEVRALVAAQSTVTLWQLLAVQAAVSAALLVLLAVFAGGVWVKGAAAGVLVGLLPAFVGARMWSRRQAQSPSQALLGLMAWELLKIVLSVALLVLAVLVVPGLHWLGLLLGMIVSMKAGWLYLLLGRKSLAFSKNQ